MNKDLAASVRARLLNIAKAQGSDFNQVLVRFAADQLIEGFDWQGGVFDSHNSPASGSVTWAPGYVVQAFACKIE